MEKNICNICGGKYVLKDGHFVCEKCGHFASNESENKEGTDFINTTNNEEKNIEEKIEENSFNIDTKENEVLEESFDSSMNDENKEIDENLENSQKNEEVSKNFGILSNNFIKENNSNNELKPLKEIGEYYEAHYNPDLEKKMKVGYSLLINGLFNDALNIFESLLRSNQNARIKLSKILANNKLNTIDDFINSDSCLFSNLGIFIDAIDASSKEDAYKYLLSLMELVFDLINKSKFDKAYDIYSKICNYNIDVIQSKHSQIIEYTIENFDYSQDVFKIIDLALKYIIPNKEEYSKTIFNLIIELINYEESDDSTDNEIKEISKYYNQAKEILKDDFDFILLGYCVKEKNSNSMEALASYIASKDINLKEDIDALNSENINKFLNILSNCITSNFYNEDFINNFDQIDERIRLILTYEFDQKNDFISNLCDLFIDNPWDIYNSLFESLINIKYSNDREGLCNAYVQYSNGLLQDKDFQNAEKYANFALSLNKNNTELLILLFLISIKAENIEKISENIINFNDLELFERLLASFNDEEQKIGFISNMAHACIEYICIPEAYLPEFNMHLFDVFDSIIKYYPESAKGELVNSLYELSDLCLEQSFFEQAEKYYQMIIDVGQNECYAHWGLLKAILKCEDDDKLIKQSTLIGNLPEYINAISESGDDQQAFDHFIECKTMQEEYLKKKEQDEENKKITETKNKKKRKIILISSIVVGSLALIISVTTALTINVFIPMNIYNDSLAMINEGKYEEAYEKLDTISKDGYKDKEKQKTICKAGIAFKEGDFETGISYFTNAGGKVNVEYDANGGKVNKNNETLSNENKNYFINDLNVLNHEDIDFDSKDSINNFINNDPSKVGYTFNKWVIKNYKITTACENYKCDLTLEALYSTITYNISYDLNGGYCEDLPTTYNIESKDITLNEPIKTGYTFTGWTWEGNKTPTKNVTISKGSIGDRKYIANYKANTYKVLLEYGYNLGKKYVDVTYDSYYKFDDPVRTGYNFDHWDYDGQKIAKEGTWKIASNATLDAKYSAKVYRIKFNLDGGTNNNQTTYTIETPTFNLADPTKTGYTFTGWTGEGNTKPTKNVTIQKGTTGDKEYTANYTANTYKVTFDYKDGKTTVTHEYKYDSNYSFDNGYKEGYKFKYWTYNGKEISSKGIWKIAGNVTLEAVYETRQYNIYCDLNGGSFPSGYSNKIPYTVETETFTLREPTKTNYTFIGWTTSTDKTLKKDYQIEKGSYGDKYLTANYETKIYLYQTESAGNYSSQTVRYNDTYSISKPTRAGYQFVQWYYYKNNNKNNTKEFIESNGTWTYDGYLRLYAEWAQEYHITYDLDGGSFVSEFSNLTIFTPLTETFTIPDAYKEGYEFLGWSIESRNESQAIKNFKVNKGTNWNFKLYANFKKIENQTPTE